MRGLMGFMRGMVEFEKIEELIGYLQEEKGKKRRYAACFILVEDIEVWTDLIERLKFTADKTVALSSCCSSGDIFPKMGEVYDLLSNTGSGETVLLLPVSEWLRLDFERGKDFLVRIAELPASGGRRVYIPLFRGREMLENIFSILVRYRIKFIDDYEFYYAGKKAASVCQLEILPFKLDRDGTEVVEGIKDYLSLWENGARDYVCLSTSWAPSLTDVFSVHHFEVVVYKSAYYWLKSTDNSFAFEREWGSKEDWKWLAGMVARNGDLEKVFRGVFNIASYDRDILFINWHTYDRHKKWLAWLWCQREEKEGSYLYEVLKEQGRLEDLEKNAVLKIFSLPAVTPELCCQRKVLLVRLGVKAMPDYFWQEYESLDDPLGKLCALTDISERERENIVWCAARLLEEGEESWQAYLQVIYPDLWNYLYGLTLEDRFADAYFKAYNRCRVKDKCDDELLNLLAAWNEEKLWAYPVRRDVLEKERTDASCVIWIDAMGVEWAGLFLHELQEEGLAVDVKVCRSALPTITEYNREWRENDEMVANELDRIAHDPNYCYPAYFLKALSFIKYVVEKVRENIAVYKRVIVTSDHGLSRFALKNGQKIEGEGLARVERGGRYAVLEKGDVPQYVQADLNPNFCVKEDKIIIMDYSRFKGSGMTGGEVHGGAAPEECLVPLVIVERRGEEEIYIKLISKIVEFNLHREGTLEIEVNKDMPGLKLKIGSRYFEGQQQGGRRWAFILKGLEEKDYEADLWAGSRRIGSVAFAVKHRRGIEQDDLGL